MKEIYLKNGKKEALIKGTKNINDLFFNPYNTRHQASLDKLRTTKEFNEDNLYSWKIQNEIYKLFLKTNNKQKEALINSIKNLKGVEKPLIITADNVVLSGNNRLSILKYLNEKGHDVNVNVPVRIYNKKNLTQKEIDWLETSLQYRGEEKVDYEAYEKAMKIHKHSRKNEIPNDEIADLFSIKIDDVKRNIEIIDEFYNFLNKMGNPKYTTLFSEIDLWSVVEYTSQESFKKLNPFIKTNFKDILYALPLTNIPFNKIRTSLNKVLRVNIPTKNKEDIFKGAKEYFFNEKINKSYNKSKELIKNLESFKENDDYNKLIHAYDRNAVVVELDIFIKDEIEKIIDPDEAIEKLLIKINKDIIKININSINQKDKIINRLQKIRDSIDEKWKILK